MNTRAGIAKVRKSIIFGLILSSLPPLLHAQQGQPTHNRLYFGPRPPAGDPPHDHHFQLFALDTKLDMPDGFNHQALLEAMQGHELAERELVGLFQAPQ